MKKYKVVLVDDEYMILEGLKVLIDWESIGFEIAGTFKKADDALQYIEKEEVDVLLTDVTMPQKSGLSLIREVKEMNDNIVTAILSGYQEFDYIKKGLSLGIKQYLVKPVNKDELLKIMVEIHQYLEDRIEMNNRKEYIIKSYLARWLDDELSEQEFMELNRLFKENYPGPYTPIKIIAEKILMEELSNFFVKHNQGMVLLSEDACTVIYSGNRLAVLSVIAEIEKTYDGSNYLLIHGETVTEWDSLFLSYKKILQILSIRDFYEVKATTSNELTLLSPEKLLDKNLLLNFTKSLLIGNKENTINELKKIFKELALLQLGPEYDKMVGLLLLLDIYKETNQLTENQFQKYVRIINKSEVITEIEYVLKTLISEEAKEQPKEYSPTTQKVIKYLNTHFCEDISLKDISEKLYFNSVYLGQLFKKETDFSFNQFLNRLRIKKAQELLTYTDKTINEISFEIGYNNTNYFSKMFKKLNGITPKEYKDKYNN